MIPVNVSCFVLDAWYRMSSEITKPSNAQWLTREEISLELRKKGTLKYKLAMFYDGWKGLDVPTDIQLKLTTEFPQIWFTWDLRRQIDKIVGNHVIGMREYVSALLWARVLRYIDIPDPMPKDRVLWIAKQVNNSEDIYPDNLDVASPKYIASWWADAKFLFIARGDGYGMNMPHFEELWPPERILWAFDKMCMSIWIFPMSPNPTYDEIVQNEHVTVQEVMLSPLYRKALEDKLPIVVKKRWIERNLEKIWHRGNDIIFSFN